MYLRKAESRDLPVIDGIFSCGRQFLKEQGLPQWQNGYGPTVKDAQADIERGEGYALIACKPGIDEVVGYAALIVGKDESYENIRGGEWDASHSSYVSIHRVALLSKARGKGLAKFFIKELISEAQKNNFKDIRIDTHENNSVMRRVIEGSGFVYRGVVEYPIPFGERIAYQFASNML